MRKRIFSTLLTIVMALSCGFAFADMMSTFTRECCGQLKGLKSNRTDAYYYFVKDALKIVPNEIKEFINSDVNSFYQGVYFIEKLIDLGKMTPVGFKKQAPEMVEKDIRLAADWLKEYAETGAEAETTSVVVPPAHRSRADIIQRLGIIVAEAVLINFPDLKDSYEYFNYKKELNYFLAVPTADMVITFDGTDDLKDIHGRVLERTKRSKGFDKSQIDLYVAEQYNTTVNDIIDFLVETWKLAGRQYKLIVAKGEIIEIERFRAEASMELTPDSRNVRVVVDACKECDIQAYGLRINWEKVKKATGMVAWNLYLNGFVRNRTKEPLRIRGELRVFDRDGAPVRIASGASRWLNLSPFGSTKFQWSRANISKQVKKECRRYEIHVKVKKLPVQ